MEIISYKINPIEDYLLANGYELMPRLERYEKPRYKKGSNQIEVCWTCGYVIINGSMQRFWKLGIPNTLKIIPV